VTGATDRQQVLSIVVRELAPYLGANMARSATKMHSEKLGLLAPELSATDIERLLDALVPGLRVFLGKDKTEDALHLVRKALASEGGAR
jgi:hypothetical protein